MLEVLHMERNILFIYDGRFPDFFAGERMKRNDRNHVKYCYVIS
jgi:hypothetical protein